MTVVYGLEFFRSFGDNDTIGFRPDRKPPTAFGLR
jgi:hypothetical protein